MTKKKLAILGGDPVRKEFLVYGAPDIGEEEINEVVACMKSGWLSTGIRTETFEKELAEYTGASYGVATNSCTAAMHLSLIAKGIGSGDEVITTPITFGATANVIEHVGATLILADIKKEGFSIDPRAIEDKITSKTKAIIPVHFAGYPCDMDEIENIAAKHGLIIIEDAAHALGTKYKNRMIGNGDNLNCFSFYVTKNIVAGEGGIVTTNDKELADMMRIYGLHGMSHGAWKRYSKNDQLHYEITYPGFKYNMADLNAAIVTPQLKKIEKFIVKRKKLAYLYRDIFKDEEAIILPPEMDESSGSRCAWHLFPIMIREEILNTNRDEIMKSMIKENIGVATHFRAIFEQQYYKNKYTFNSEDYPNAKFVSDRVFSIPLSSKMTIEDLEDVVVALKKVIDFYKNKKK